MREYEFSIIRINKRQRKPTDGSIKNRQSRDTDNVGHKTQNEEKHKKMSVMDPTKIKRVKWILCNIQPVRDDDRRSFVAMTST